MIPISQKATGGRHPQRGALLLEHVVALAVFAMIATVIFALLCVGQLAESLAQSQSAATYLAQSKLEQMRAAGVDAAVSTARQSVDPAALPGYEWQVDVVELGPQLRQIETTVYWKVRGRERSLTLLTLVGGW